MVLQKVWEGAKFTAETVRGAALVLAKPNDPVPPAKLHPRMMPMPFTVGEWFRMNSWRHLWMYMPVVRTYVFGALGTFALVKIFFPTTASGEVKAKESDESAHHHEKDMFFGRRQREQDKAYFEKYDPLRIARPDAFNLVYGGGH